MVVVLEMLTLMVLMLMEQRTESFAIRLCLPPQLLSSFAWCVVMLVMIMIGWDVSRSTVSIAHGKYDG